MSRHYLNIERNNKMELIIPDTDLSRHAPIVVVQKYHVPKKTYTNHAF